MPSIAQTKGGGHLKVQVRQKGKLNAVVYAGRLIAPTQFSYGLTMRYLSLAWLVFLGCSFDGKIPAGALVGCTQNSDCPNAGFCVAFGRCVNRDLLFELNEGRLSPLKIGPNQSVKIQLTPTAPFDGTPMVFGVTEAGRTEATVLSATAPYEYEWRLPEGSIANQVLFLANVMSLQKNNIEIGTVEVDREGPVLELREVQLKPHADALRLLGPKADEISALTNGTAVAVKLVSNEPLAEPPRVSLENVALELTERSGLEYRYKGTLEQLGADGKARLLARAVDAQGNVSEFTLATYDIDTTPPAPPLVAPAEQVVLVREPGGTLDGDRKTPRYAIRAKPGSVEAGSTVVVTQGGGIFLQVTAAEDGSISETSVPLQQDTANLTLRSIDRAGNLSTEVKLLDTELVIVSQGSSLATVLVASEQSRVPVFPRENATRAGTQDAGLGTLEVVARAQPHLLRQVELPTNVGSPTVAVNGAFFYAFGSCSTTQASTVAAWVGYDSGISGLVCGAGPVRGQFAGSFVSLPVGFLLAGATATELERGETKVEYLVVGKFGVGVQSTAGQLEKFTLLSGQLARQHHVAAVDFSRSEVVIFGGVAADGKLLDDTWVYSPELGLQARALSGDRPSARKFAAMAYDPIIGKVVLHGGNDGTKTLNDTWTFDGVTWQRLVETTPVAREQHVLGAFGFNGLVMSGGVNQNRAVLEAARWKNGWNFERVFTPTTAVPAVCNTDNRAFVIPSTVAGNTYLCDTSAPTDPVSTYEIISPKGQRAPIADPPYESERTVVYGHSTLGLVAFLEGGKASDSPVYRLDAAKGQWLVTALKGSCSLFNGDLACISGDAVTYADGTSTVLPSDGTILRQVIWGTSAGQWFVNRTSAGGSVRYEIKNKVVLLKMTDNIPAVTQVIFSGLVGSYHVSVFREESENFFSEIGLGAQRAVSEGAFQMSEIDTLALTQAPDGRPLGYINYYAFSNRGLGRKLGPKWFRVVTEAIQPSIHVDIPSPTGCATLYRMELEAEAWASAGGVQGVALHPWNGQDFSPAPHFAVTPSKNRPKVVVPTPSAYFRLGFPNRANIANLNIVAVVPVGASKGPFDAEVHLTALQTRFACRTGLQ